MYYNAKFVREQLLGVKRKELACRGETNKEYESNPMSGASGAYQHSPQTIRTLAGVLGGALLALVLLGADSKKDFVEKPCRSSTKRPKQCKRKKRLKQVGNNKKQVENRKLAVKQFGR